MSLKKSLKSSRRKSGQKGQSVLEYFILLAVVAALALIATSRLFSTTHYEMEKFTNAAAGAMAPNPG